MTTTPRTLFDGAINTCYRTMTVRSPECESIMPDEARAGQINGICGGAVPGLLFMTVGNCVGPLPIRVELHESAPPLDLSWDDIVEVSCDFDDTPIYLEGWAGDGGGELLLDDGAYRARFCANAHGESTQIPGDEAMGEKYLLMFWLAPWQPDQIIKETHAGYWHQVAAREAASAAAVAGQRATPQT